MYALLRTARPVLRIPIEAAPGYAIWLLTRYEDVRSALRDPRFSVDRLSAPVIRDNVERMPAFIRQGATGLRSMLVVDPPDHTRMRKLANQAFTPKRIAALHDRVEALVDEIVGAWSPGDRIDLIHELAEPLPAIVIAELLGVPPDDHRQFREWSSALIAGVGGPPGGDAQRASAAASLKILDYMRAIIAERRANPKDDLISALIAAQEERDALSDDELLATCNLILLAGHETTTNLIGNGTLALLREPDGWSRLHDEPALLPTAIEELLRFDGPVQATIRVAREDVALGDAVIAAGDPVILSIGAANHDPAVFDDPERLDLARDPNPHLAFGFATHFCMGAPLARMEGEIAFRALTRRFPSPRLVDEAPAYRPNPILRGMRRLELALG